MVSLVPPGSGLERAIRQRSHTRRPPLGQPQLNVPRERSRPRGRPLQPRFPKEHHHRRAADDSLCGLVPQSNVVVSLEMEREEGEGGVGLGRHLSAAARLRMHSTTAQSFSEVLQQ